MVVAVATADPRGSTASILHAAPSTHPWTCDLHSCLGLCSLLGFLFMGRRAVDAAVDQRLPFVLSTCSIHGEALMQP